MNNLQITKVQPQDVVCCVAFASFFANLSLALLIKKACIATIALKFVNKVGAKIYRKRVLEFKRVT